MEAPDPAGAPPAANVLSAEYLRLLVICAVMGLPVAVLAAAYTSFTERAREALWTDLPDAAGWAEPPAWYVLALPVAGGLIVALALRMPGRGGHLPFEPFSLAPMPPAALPGVLLAASASLAFGLVLGPEAPLIVLGVVAGALTARLVGATGPGGRLITVAGAFAAISIVLGGPLVSSLALFEILAVSGAVASAAIVPTLAPGFVAAGTGALAYTGIADWPGLNQAALHGPDLVDYPSVRLPDVAWSLAVALLVGVAAALARPIAKRVDRSVSARPTAALLAGGLAVGAIAVAFRAASDRPVDLVLFSGQTSLPAIAAEGSAGVLALVVVAKAVCLAISMGAGFRGGAIFPSVAIGAAAGAMCAVILPGLATTPAVVAGIAAGTAAGMRMPVFGAVLAALLVPSDISDAIPIAVVAAVAGWLVALAVDRLLARREALPAGAAAPGP